MAWWKRNQKQPTKELQVPDIRFLGEQDGPAEINLKDKFVAFFRRDKSINRAYLARADFGEGTKVSSVLGLRTQFGPDKGMVEKIGSIFASVFNSTQHLDIVFLTDQQEGQ